MPERQFYVYVLASHSKRLYIGTTLNLERRIAQHRRETFARAHTGRYRIYRLVYYETTTDPRAANVRERQLKGWLRSRKVALIEATNPSWADLASGWFVGGRRDPLRSDRATHPGRVDPSLRSG